MTDLDRVTDLFEKWAAEEGEHRQAGKYGLAEGLRVAIEDLRAAVHGGRAETTTDEWCRAEDCQHRHWRSGSIPTHKRGNDCPTPAETTTATTEDKSVIELAATVVTTHTDEPMWSAVVIAKEMASRGLLATARTRPTRHQVIRALFGERDPWEDLTEKERRQADAVLALLADQPDHASIAAQALDSMAEFFETSAALGTGDRDLIAAAAVRERAARLRGGDDR